MSFIQENKIILNLNLKHEYHFIHFSDVHAISYEKNDSEKEKNKAIENEKAWDYVKKDFAKHFNEYFGKEHEISSKECLCKLIDYTNKENPNLLVLTGDIIDYNSNSNFKFLKEELNTLKCPYLFTNGNHEAQEEFYDEITNSSSDFNVYEFEDLLVIGIDDSLKSVSENQLNKLKNEVKKNKSIILCMHIPLLTKYNEKEMEKYDSYFIINYKNCNESSKAFIDYVTNEPLIKAILCGHTHGASTTYINKNKPQLCASSGLIGFVNNIIIK